MLTLFTIVLDGMPWLAHHYPVFCQLKMPWRWIVVEGVADNVFCTSWCAKLPPRLSNDGTTEYLQDLMLRDSRVTHLKQPHWSGKVAMCNEALKHIDKPCLLWQVDADELWTAKQIEATVELFDRYKEATSAYFWCRYFVGPDRYIAGRDCYGNHSAYEWKRVWRFTPGDRFLAHEPPVMSHERLALKHAVTEAEGCVFTHMAYSSRKQMEFRAQYYAGDSNPNAHLWRNCLDGWDRLQAVTEFPVKLKDFFPWVDDKAMVVRA